MKKKRLVIAAILLFAFTANMTVSAQRIRHDKQKEKQWRSMEVSPWDFAPDWYYYFSS